MTAEVIRLVVVDDHTMFVDSLVRTLSDEPSIEVVGSCGTVAEAMDVVAGADPHVVVVDHQLPDGNGVELARSLRRAWPDLALVMLTGTSDAGVFDRAVAAGCTGFVTKDRAVTELVQAVRAVRDGKTYISEPQLGDVLPEVATRGRPAGLSARELEALQLAAQGLPNRAIAEAMFLSSHTVKNYMQSAIGKLGAHSKLEAVTIAIREGIVTVDR